MKKACKKITKKILSPKDIVKKVSSNTIVKNVPELGGDIEIKIMSWPEMLEIQKGDDTEADREMKLMSNALSISLEDVQAMRNGNGKLYAVIISAVNEVYNVGEEEVKKQ